MERQHLEQVASVGKEVLDNTPWLPGACTLMSAVWTARVRDRLARDQIVFGTGATDLSTAFNESNPAWDGHCWVAFGEYVGDASVFRTAYSRQAPKALQQLVLEQFGKGRGLALAKVSAMAEDGLTYVPKYVLTEAQLDALVRSAAEVVRRVLDQLPTET
jgi:hypothetical protein